jgi:curved DNA-binding protein CbpA
MMDDELSVWEAYSILGLSTAASASDARKAFRRLALEAHPDKHRGDPQATVNFQRLNAAWQRIQLEEERGQRAQRNTGAQPADDPLLAQRLASIRAAVKEQLAQALDRVPGTCGNVNHCSACHPINKWMGTGGACFELLEYRRRIKEFYATAEADQA